MQNEMTNKCQFLIGNVRHPDTGDIMEIVDNIICVNSS